MRNHDDVIAGDRHIHFEGIDARLNRVPEGRDRVFRSLRPRTAMSMYKNFCLCRSSQILHRIESQKRKAQLSENSSHGEQYKHSVLE